MLRVRACAMGTKTISSNLSHRPSHQQSEDVDETFNKFPVSEQLAFRPGFGMSSDGNRVGSVEQDSLSYWSSHDWDLQGLDGTARNGEEVTKRSINQLI